MPVEEVDWSKLQEQVCSICYCELYENLQDNDAIEKLDAEQKGFLKPIEVVQMGKCKGHFFHAECLESMLQSQGGKMIRCPMCNQFYGELRGSCPSGTMTISNSHHKL